MFQVLRCHDFLHILLQIIKKKTTLKENERKKSEHEICISFRNRSKLLLECMGF